jgi:hypothetical protein
MGIGSKNRRKQLERTYIIKQLNGNSLADGNIFNRPIETVKQMLTVLTHRWKKHKEKDKNHFIR